MRNLFRYISFALSVVVSMCFVSCDKEETTSVGGKDTAYFPIGNNIEIHPLGDTLYVSFTSDVNWYVELNSSESDWLDISLNQTSRNTYQKGTTQFIISADTYKGDMGSSDNVATLKFYSNVYKNRELLHTVEISQHAAYIDIENVSGLEGDFEWYAEGSDKSRTYKVTSNIHWECDFLHDDMFTTNVSEGGNLNGETRNITIQANDINLGEMPLSTSLMFKAVKKNGAKKTLMDSEFAGLGLKQDNLVFDAPDAFSDIGELGGYVFSSQTDYSDPDWAEVEVVTETDYNVLWRNVNEGAFMHLGEGDQWFTLVTETIDQEDEVRTDKLRVEVASANPTMEPRAAVIRIESNINNRAYRDIKLTQNPYTWEIEIGELSASETSSTEIKIKTRGPWSIQPPVKEDWWDTDETEWSGEGDKTIVLESHKWNLDTLNNLTTQFLFSNACNDLTASHTLVKNHFRFNIGKNLVNSTVMARSKLAELLKKDAEPYSIQVDCSGPWSCNFIDADGLDSLWVNIDKKSGLDEFINIGASSVNTSDYDRLARIVFTSHIHREAGYTMTDTLSLKQLKHTFSWAPDEWTDEVMNQNCNQPAYIGNGYTFGFTTTFSDVWSLTSDQSWVKFHLNGGQPSETISGDGNSDNEGYVYVTVDNNYNTGSLSRKATVTVCDEFKNEYKSFTITQNPFVFEVGCQNSYEIGPFDTNTYDFNYRITKNAPFKVTVTDSNGLLKQYSGAANGTGNTETFTFAANAVSDVNKGDRTATVKISVDGNSALSKTFTVSQSEYNFQNLSSPSKFDEVNLNMQSIQIDCYADDWAIGSSPSWLSAVRKGKYLQLTPNAVNTSLTASNTGNVVITTPFGGSQKQITLAVEQDKYIFDISPVSLEFEPLDETSVVKTLTVSASAGWSNGQLSRFALNKSADMLKVNVKEKNYQTSPQTETLLITSEHGHSKSVTVTQKQYVFSISEFKDTSISKDGQNITFNNLSCSGDLDVEVKGTGSGWLTIQEKPTKSNGGKLVLNATANTASKATARTASVRLYSKDESKNSTLSKEITITQNK